MRNENYISMKDLYELLPVGKNQSDKLFHTMEQEMVNKGYKLFNTRPRVLPKEFVFKYLKGERIL